MKINLRKRLPKKIFNIVKMVGEIADRERVQAYIVGGPVRDMFLNVIDYDLDFVVETNGIRFAEVLSKVVAGELKIHRAFKTATIMHKCIRIDIVTARNESYESPAAYPDVQPGTIKQDLFRRDFTINAMAISINKKDFGKLIDFYNGYDDLKKGIIRVMHDKSFVDDPTRIFRAVRFSARFGFKIETQTKRLIKKAILAGLLGELNRGRVRKEIELFLKEKKPMRCMELFSNLI